MLEALRAYIKSVASFLIFIMIIKTISAEKYKDYINFICSVVLIIVMVEPMMNVLNRMEIEQSVFKAVEFGGYEDVPDDNTLMNVFVNEVKEEIKKEADKSNIEIENIEITSNDDFVIESIVITGDSNSSFERYIKKDIGAKEIIFIESTGGDNY